MTLKDLIFFIDIYNYFYFYFNGFHHEYEISANLSKIDLYYLLGRMGLINGNSLRNLEFCFVFFFIFAFFSFCQDYSSISSGIMCIYSPFGKIPVRCKMDAKFFSSLFFLVTWKNFELSKHNQNKTK